MFSQTDTTYDTLVGALVNFYHSPFVLVVKILLAIYLIVVIVDIILLLKLRGITGNIRTGLRGMDMPTTTASKMRKRWDLVLQRLESGDMSQYKVAVIEADSIADDILKGVGYGGNDMTERLAHIKPQQLDGLEELKSVHQIRNRIVHEADFALDKEMAHEAVKVYENFLRYLEFL